MREIKRNIDIKLDGVNLDSYYTGTVRIGNNSSARINVPKRFIDKKFILVFLPDKKEG